MTDQELADKVVALGIAEGPNNYVAYSLNTAVRNWQSMDTFVRDWLIAGTLMEKVDITYLKGRADGVWRAWHVGYVNDGVFENESLSRVIIEAAVETLS